MTDKLRKQIAMCLLKNIETFRQTGVEIKNEWINQENLNIKIPQRILETMGVKDYATTSYTDGGGNTSTSNKNRKGTTTD